MNNNTRKKKIERRSLLARFARPLLYFPALKQIGLSIEATILFTQLEYWFDKQLVKTKKHYFYKFIEPPKGENSTGYTIGDSWCEELGWTAKEFRKAFKEIGAMYKSKGSFDKQLNKSNPMAIFKTTIITKQRTIQKGKKSKVNAVKEDRYMSYASYYDRMRRKTYFFRNDEIVDITLEVIIANDPNAVKSKPIQEVYEEVQKEEDNSTRTPIMAVPTNTKMAVPLSEDYQQDINIYTDSNTASAGLTTKKEISNSTLVVSKSSDDKSKVAIPTKRLLDYKRRISGMPASTYNNQLGSGHKKLVPLRHTELYKLAVKKQISPKNLFLTYEEVLTQIENGEIPNKYKFNNTYTVLSRWIDNKLRFGVYDNVNEIGILELNDWTKEKLDKMSKLDAYKQHLQDKGKL